MSGHPESPLTMGAFIRDRAARFGDDEFIVTPESRVTYREVEERSRELAKRLTTVGVGKGSRVGILFGNGPHWVIAWLASGRIGAVAVTVNTYCKPPELRRALRHADVQVLLMAQGLLHHDFQERLEEALPDLRRHESSRPLYLPDSPALRSVWVAGDDLRPWATPYDSVRTAVDDDFLAELEADVAPSDPFTVIYTSGSTAEPKGVIHAHAAVIRHSGRVRDRCDLPLLHGDKGYSPMPFFWVGGMVIVLMNAMHGGATVCCLPRFEPEVVLDFMERERVTAFLGWPHSSNALAGDPRFQAHDLSALRTPIGTTSTVKRHATLGMTETLGPHTAGSRDAPPLRRDQEG